MDWLLILVLLWGAVALLSLFLMRRSLKRIERLPTGLRGSRHGKVMSTTDPGKKALISFNEKLELFRWEGEFEGKKAVYSFYAGTGYTTLELAKGNDRLLISYFAKSPQRGGVFSLLPYKIEVNARGVYSSDLLKDPAEALLIRELLKSYFTSGIKKNYDLLGVKTCEAVEALLFSYHTFHRFQETLKRKYPEFLERIHRYQGKSLLELIGPFKREGKSREELELELRRAVSEEDYERAALIQRELKALEKSQLKPPEGPEGERGETAESS